MTSHVEVLPYNNGEREIQLGVAKMRQSMHARTRRGLEFLQLGKRVCAVVCVCSALACGIFGA